jgi:CRP/FNR family transcriptional regulator, cyclic AMP receptor protein
MDFNFPTSKGQIGVEATKRFTKKRGRDHKPVRFLESEGSGRKMVRCRKKQAITNQGDAARHVYYICDGIVKSSVISKEGKEAVIGILGPGEFFGDGAITGAKAYRSTATATTECRLLRIEARRLLQEISRDRAFAAYFLNYLMTRKARVESDLVDQIFNSSEKRLARTLLLMARMDGKGRSKVMIPRISQETLASMVGTTRSRISFFMNRFRGQGHIKYNGGIQVNGSLVHVLQRD